MRKFIDIISLNKTSMGYALFLAVTAAGVWGGVFPFLSDDFQTSKNLFSFFLAQSITFTLTFLLVAILSYVSKISFNSRVVIITGIPYFLGWAFLITALYISYFSLALVVFAGIFLGIGSAGFYLLWQRIFATQDNTHGNHNLIVGTGLAAIIYFSLYIIPKAVTVYLIPFVFLPLFGLAIVLSQRELNLDQPMHQDPPYEHKNIYKKVISDYWRSAIAVGAIGLSSGVIRSYAIVDPTTGALVNIMSMGGSFICAVALLWIWQYRNFRFNIITGYRLVFPFLITAFILLPVFHTVYPKILAGLIYAIYNMAIILMMIQCAQVSRDRGIHPLFIYGLFGLVVYFMHNAGFVGATVIEAHVSMKQPLLATAAFVVYLIGLTYFLALGGFKQVTSRKNKAENIELIALHPSLEQKGFLSESQLEDEYDEDLPEFKDRFSKQAAAVQEKFGLTTRETEVMELLARGNSTARVAELLVLSENTIRTHSKRIYSKVNVNKKQELLDLIESFEPIRAPKKK